MGAIIQREKLAAVLGMMGSDFDHEVLVAARMAEKLRREAGATWHELLAAPESTPPQIDVLDDWPTYWLDAARFVAQGGMGLVRDKDIAFARNVARYEHTPSARQLAYLFDLVRKVQKVA